MVHRQKSLPVRIEAFDSFGRKCYGFIYPPESRESIHYFRQQCEIVSEEERRARKNNCSRVRSQSACLKKRLVLKYELFLTLASSFKRTR